MKLVLRADVAQVGKKGDIVDVADGYGRNFLVPKGLAFLATAGVEAQADAMRRSRDVRDASDRAAAEEVATQPRARRWSRSRPAPAPRASCSARSPPPRSPRPSPAQTGVELDRRQLHLDEPIKTLGTHLVPAKLHAEVEFPITVEVVAS